MPDEKRLNALMGTISPAALRRDASEEALDLSTVPDDEFPGVYDDRWVQDELVTRLMGKDGWGRQVQGLYRVAHAGQAKTPRAHDQVAALLAATRKQSTSEPLYRTLLTRSDSPDVPPIRIPNLVALIDSQLPSNYRKGRAVQKVLGDIAFQWYANDYERMAKDSGQSTSRLRALLRGKAVLEDYASVEALAKGLRIPKHQFDIAWFADRLAHTIPVTPATLFDEKNIEKRAQLLLEIASIRQHVETPLLSSALASIEASVSMVKFLMQGAIPPETALLMIAGVALPFKRFYQGAGLSVERFRRTGNFEDAALASFLASDFFLQQRTIAMSIAMASIAVDDVIMGRLSAFIDLGLHYLVQGIAMNDALYEGVKENTSHSWLRMDARIIPHDQTISHMREKVELLSRAQQLGFEAAEAVAVDGRNLYAYQTTAARRYVFQELQGRDPRLLEAIVERGRGRIIGSAFQVLDPKEDRDALSPLLFHGVVRKLAAREGIVAALPPDRSALDQGVSVVSGATMTFGGVVIPINLLRPLLR